jgi:hypothetical protein
MKQCIRCDREYPDSERFCEMDGAYLVSLDELNELPMVSALLATVFHRRSVSTGKRLCTAPFAMNTGKVTLEEAERWGREMQEKYGAR